MDNDSKTQAAAPQPGQEEPQPGGAAPNAAERATQPTKPTVLRSHFKGLPKDWERNQKANAEAAAEQEKKPSEGK